jgi:hypothetical protein
MPLADIRAQAERIAVSTNYEAQPNTPTKKLARLVAALAVQMEQPGRCDRCANEWPSSFLDEATMRLALHPMGTRHS